MKPKLSVCVVNFNGGDPLLSNLSAILRQGEIVDQVILVDNASSDGSPGRAAARFPGVELISLESNQGPGAARNAGFRAARNPRILFVDSDVELAPGCAERLWNAVEGSERIVAAMPRVRYASDPAAVQCDGAGCHYLGFMTIESWEGTEQRPIGSIVSACFLLDRSRWGESDPFDDAFFIYYEDHDLGYRARARGWELAGVPAAECFHGAGTPGLSYRPGQPYPRQRIELLIRNRWQVVLKNYEARSLMLLAPAFALFELSQLAGMIAKGWFGDWLRAAKWVVAERRRLAEKRRELASVREVQDRALLTSGALPLHPGLVQGGMERFALRILDECVSIYWRLIHTLW